MNLKMLQCLSELIIIENVQLLWLCFDDVNNHTISISINIGILTELSINLGVITGSNLVL